MCKKPCASVLQMSCLLMMLLVLSSSTYGEESSANKVNRYKMTIEEKGTIFSEKINVDEKEDVEVFRVPAHNNVDGADFYHDFKMRMTVTRILSQKVCYISKMDPSLPSPKKLKGDLGRAASQPGKLPVETKSHILKVTRPADRLLLTEKILEFCGALPIYHTEIYNNTSNEDYQVGRMKRQVTSTVTTFNRACNSVIGSDPNNPFAHVEACLNQGVPLDIRCKMRRRTCFYFVTCDYRPSLDWICREVHSSSAVPACCDFVCSISG